MSFLINCMTVTSATVRKPELAAIVLTCTCSMSIHGPSLELQFMFGMELKLNLQNIVTDLFVPHFFPVGPLITPGDDRVPVEVGGVVSLVSGTGLESNPASSIEWRDNNGVVIADGGRYTFDNGPSTVSLRIADVTANDAGDWRCTITVMADGRTIGTSDRNITLFVVGKKDSKFCSDSLSVSSVCSCITFLGLLGVCEITFQWGRRLCGYIQ